MRFFVLSVCFALAATVGCKGHWNNAGLPSPKLAHHLPPAPMLHRPGPGVDGPGPGVMGPVMAMGAGAPAAVTASQVAFIGPEGMMVQWDVTMPGAFDSESLVAPGRYNFPQGAIYRIKLTNLIGRPGVELYPTLEVAPSMPRTDAFLAHNAIPFQLTEEDFDQVLSGNFVTKVIYLPDPEFQELALAGVETLVSTRLDPGVDPIIEADRRGAILAIIRLGNKDLELPAVAVGEGMVAPGMMAVPAAYPAPFVAGVTAPQYGMPMSGTPIGLPGPPHIPLGAPAGLQKHVIVNHTKVHMPQPSDKIRMDVKHQPGISYPQPANHVNIVERAHAGHADVPALGSNGVMGGGYTAGGVPCP